MPTESTTESTSQPLGLDHTQPPAKLNIKLLAAAISALIDRPVITYDEWEKNQDRSEQFKPLDIKQFYEMVAPRPLSKRAVLFAYILELIWWALALEVIFTLVMAPIKLVRYFMQPKAPLDQGQGRSDANKTTLFVKTSNTTLTVPFTQTDTITQLKKTIAQKEGTAVSEQRLFYAGKELKDTCGVTLRDYGIQQNSTISSSIPLPGGQSVAMYIAKEFLEPDADLDFTDMEDDGKKYYRGEDEYHLPYGYMRYGLKVKGKYDSDSWLQKKTTVRGQKKNIWPVSYHGTSMANAKSIAKEGFDLAKGVSFAFGYGIYSAPHPNTARGYAKTFSFEGKSYIVLMQNRVNPHNLQRVGSGNIWISPSNGDIRPYGLCIKQVDY
ncbi:hypothetical protein TWF481_010221 [Arthrobotrys musiformis]|uniref:Ubiquitin-like domain-containing protein n=1 Tax=Arthrobotrys musiformis TaxID=47236 RepID=A0AAV9W1I5_9PEZI